MPLNPEQVRIDVTRALTEDVGTGDLTAGLIPADRWVSATVICREDAVLAGTAWFEETCKQTDPAISVHWHAGDGERLKPDQQVCQIDGPAAKLLTAERTALNFMQTLSATATRAADYVSAVRGTQARIIDTRKTIPGLRLAQKYAVTCGGAYNHRIGLYDAILIKENHIVAAGSIAAAYTAASKVADKQNIEIEVESLEQLRLALDAGAERVLLDNFTVEQLQQAVAYNKGRARLEASGGVNLETVASIAATGVDDISVGALTKDIRAVDFSMRFTSLVGTEQ